MYLSVYKLQCADVEELLNVSANGCNIIGSRKGSYVCLKDNNDLIRNLASSRFIHGLIYLTGCNKHNGD